MATSKKTIRWKGELSKPIRPYVVRPQGLAVTDPESVARANEEMIRLTNEAIEQKKGNREQSIRQRSIKLTTVVECQMQR
jgi:hypothetical protein